MYRKDYLNVLIDLKLLNEMVKSASIESVLMVNKLKKIPGYQTKTFNTNFNNSKEYGVSRNQNYINEALLKQFYGKVGSTGLEKFLKLNKFPDNSKTIIRDIFLGFAHKISGCLKYIKDFEKVFNDVYKYSLQSELGDELAKEVDRIEESIYNVAEGWARILFEAENTFIKQFPERDTIRTDIDKMDTDFSEKVDLIDDILTSMYQKLDSQSEKVASSLPTISLLLNYVRKLKSIR